MKRPFLLLILITSVCLGGAQAQNAGRADLRRIPDRLPYRIEVVGRSAEVEYAAAGWVTTRYLGDLNGDGATDQVWAGKIGLHAGITHPHGRSEAWQTNIAPEFTSGGGCGSIDGVWDIDGDGRQELVVTSWTPDRMRWQILVLDALTGAAQATFHLPGGPDTRADGRWDGHHRVFGAISVPTADGDRRALVVVSQAGFDLEPRQVLALDFESGDVLWRFAFGSKPIARSIHVRDLDGDGAAEIAVLGGGVDNLGGRRINGTSDDHAAVFVLGADGALRWMRELGPAPASGDLQIADVDGDGRFELFLVRNEATAGHGALELYSAEGALLAALATAGVGQYAYLAPDAAGRTVGYVSFDGALRRYILSGTGIEPAGEAACLGYYRVCLQADLVDRPGPELLASGVAEGRVWLLDLDLSPLACSSATGLQTMDLAVHAVRATDGSLTISKLGSATSDRADLILEPNPRAFPWGFTLAGACLVGGLGGGAYLGLKRRRGYSRHTLRELRLQLLGRLQLSGHGAIGALSSLRRLIWHLDGLDQGYASRDRVAQIIRDLCADLQAVSLRNLKASLELAELAQLPKEASSRAGQAVARLEILLGEAADGRFDLDRLQERRGELQTVAGQAEQAFLELRKEVERQFRADPQAVLRRSLSSGQVEGVEILDALDGVPACLVDEEELAFLIDNLVENAVRAMRGQPEQRLTIAWTGLPGHVILTFADTGCGIAPDEMDLVMQPGNSRREGGGLGLPRSGELLRKYGGSLVIRASTPGEGTVMALTLPRAAVGGSRPEQGVED